MKAEFYGVKAAPPTASTIKAFGSAAAPVRFTGGQGTTFRAGDIVLKPLEEPAGGVWAAEVFSTLADSNEVRYARPIRSADASWVHGGYVASSFLEGAHEVGHYTDKLYASRAFHALLKDFPKPPFLGLALSSWAAADLVAWQQRDYDYDTEFGELIDRIIPHLKPYDSPCQLVHGDVSGNILLAESLPPAIIDFSPVWAPDGFAEGLMLVDAVTWEGAQPDELRAFEDVPNIEQLAWRGIFRRIAEQGEHMSWFGKDKTQALESANRFVKAMTYLESNF